jgi:hypothetical protein
MQRGNNGFHPRSIASNFTPTLRVSLESKKFSLYLLLKEVYPDHHERATIQKLKKIQHSSRKILFPDTTMSSLVHCSEIPELAAKISLLIYLTGLKQIRLKSSLFFDEQKALHADFSVEFLKM